MHLKFKSISRPIMLAQGLKVLPHLARACPKWPFREVPAGRYGDPVINVLQEGDDGVIQAPWIESRQRYRHPADLADSLAQHLTRCLVEENETVLVISAAAVQIGDDLAVFIGGPRSGKSLLTSCLSVSGHRAFADSILPVSLRSGECVSLGMAPRLKLPLPASFSGPLRDRVARCLETSAPHLGYLRPRDADIAPFAARASIGAFVLLDRADGAATSLRPAPASTLLKRLILGSFDSLRSTRTTLDHMHRMVTDIPCFRLVWSNPSEAVSALRARFAVNRPPESEDGSHETSRAAAPRRRASGPRTPSGRRFRHVEGIDARQVDGSMFLVDPDGEAIYHLNTLGTGLWRLLDGSHGLNDVVSVLQKAFPTVDPTLVESDAVRLIDDLADRGLLIETAASENTAEMPRISL